MMVSIGRNKILAGNMTKKAERGFTLIELLIAMAITGVVSAAIFTAFQSQQKSYIMQEDVAAMQQNLRAGMDMMVREIRMAGYDPTGNANTQIKNAESDLIYFTRDDNGDGNVDQNNDDSSEHIAFDLYISNGINILGRTTLDNAIAINENPVGHFEAPGHQPLAENIEELEFFYTFATPMVPPSLNPTAAQLIDIRSVQITMLARSERADIRFANTQAYATPGGQAWGPYNDNFRRRLLTTTVNCRNLGI